MFAKETIFGFLFQFATQAALQFQVFLKADTQSDSFFLELLHLVFLNGIPFIKFRFLLGKKVLDLLFQCFALIPKLLDLLIASGDLFLGAVKTKGGVGLFVSYCEI